MTKRLPYASGYQDLLVYKKSMELAGNIFILTKNFPKEEAYSLTNQIRRSSRSIGAQLAEAWGKRLYVKHFSSKLTDASSEVYETEHWLEIAERCEYLPSETKYDLISLCKEINRMIAGMITKADRFCNLTK